MQDNNIAKLQVKRKEPGYIASCKRERFLNYKLQERKISKLQNGRQKHC